jgi:hypothetical protein
MNTDKMIYFSTRVLWSEIGVHLNLSAVNLDYKTLSIGGRAARQFEFIRVIVAAAEQLLTPE